MAKSTKKDQAMPTLAEVRAQIEALQKQEQELLIKEREPIIADMMAKISAYKITAVELGLTTSMGQRIVKATTAASKKSEAVVMYRNGDLTWSGGRGRKPQWILDIKAAGGSIEQYRV